MRFRTSLGLSLGFLALFAIPSAGQTKTLIAPGQAPSMRAIHAEVVVMGKVIEVEKDTVEGPAYVNAPKDQKTVYKIAILKIEDPLIGARGLTQVRVGFLADAPAVLPMPPGAGAGAGGPPVARGGRLRPGVAGIALTSGQEGCFFLDAMPGSDFYIQSGGPPLSKKDETFDKDMKAVNAVVKAIDEPVAALKAKELDDRFRAASAILTRYQAVRGNPSRFSREPVPEEENKLILDLLAELPWSPKPDAAPAGGEVAPSRGGLWYMINWNEHGFKQPKNTPGVDFNKVMDEASTRFLKENGEKVKLKRLVAK